MAPLPAGPPRAADFAPAPATIPGAGVSSYSTPADDTAPPSEMFPAVTFNKGEFMFNRRFFETKMPGMFRVVPTEADRDKVLFVRSTRGEFVGRRISAITQNELHLQVFKDEVTADEMIPFVEIQEVQIRHKDAV